MAELKTKANDASVSDFIAAVPDERKRADSLKLVEMMSEVTGAPAVMWGDSIIGFGSYDYKYASGRTGTWMELAFSPRKASISLYIMAGSQRYPELLERLGKHKTGKSCLYIKRLSDVDLAVLGELFEQGVADLRAGDIDYGAC